MPAPDEFEVMLAYLKRQREDIDRRIAALEESRGETQSIVSELRRWRERVAKAPRDDGDSGSR